MINGNYNASQDTQGSPAADAFSIDNIATWQDRLSGLSDDQLKNIIQGGGPFGFLAMNEGKARTDIRAAAENEPQTTVKDAVVAGLGSISEAPQIPGGGITESVPAQAPAPMMAAQGGLIRLQEGGTPGDQLTEEEKKQMQLQAVIDAKKEAAGTPETAEEDPSYLDRAVDYIGENPLDAAALGLMAIPGIGWGASATAKGIGAAARYVPKAWKALTSPAAKRAMGTQKRKVDPKSGIFGGTKESFMAQKPFKTKAEAELALKEMNLTGGQKVVKDGSKWKSGSKPEPMRDGRGNKLKDGRGNVRYHKATTKEGDNWVIVPSGANIAKSLATSGKVAAGVGATSLAARGIAGLGAGDQTAKDQTAKDQTAKDQTAKDQTAADKAKGIQERIAQAQADKNPKGKGGITSGMSKDDAKLLMALGGSMLSNKDESLAGTFGGGLNALLAQDAVNRKQRTDDLLAEAKLATAGGASVKDAMTMQTSVQKSLLDVKQKRAELLKTGDGDAAKALNAEIARFEGVLHMLMKKTGYYAALPASGGNTKTTTEGGGRSILGDVTSYFAKG